MHMFCIDVCVYTEELSVEIKSLFLFVQNVMHSRASLLSYIAPQNV